MNESNCRPISSSNFTANRNTDTIGSHNLINKGTKVVTGAVPFQKVTFVPLRYQYVSFRYKSVLSETPVTAFVPLFMSVQVKSVSDVINIERFVYVLSYCSYYFNIVLSLYRLTEIVRVT